MIFLIQRRCGQWPFHKQTFYRDWTLRKSRQRPGFNISRSNLYMKYWWPYYTVTIFLSENSKTLPSWHHWVKVYTFRLSQCLVALWFKDGEQMPTFLYIHTPETGTAVNILQSLNYSGPFYKLGNYRWQHMMKSRAPNPGTTFIRGVPMICMDCTGKWGISGNLILLYNTNSIEHCDKHCVELNEIWA